jgi:hypothetical protein
MPRRRELKSVAYDIASFCISRNNDFEGYWAPGILSKVAKEKEMNPIDFDLLSGNSNVSGKELIELGTTYKTMLADQFERRGFSKEKIRNGNVLFRFDHSNPIDSPFLPFSEKCPFYVEVTLTDDLNNTYQRRRESWCWPHNPKFERQSTRAHA